MLKVEEVLGFGELLPPSGKALLYTWRGKNALMSMDVCVFFPPFLGYSSGPQLQSSRALIQHVPIPFPYSNTPGYNDLITNFN